MTLLDGKHLRIADVVAVARDGRTPQLAEEAARDVTACSELLDRMIADGTPIYGVTTGFGALDGRKVAPEKLSLIHI